LGYLGYVPEVCWDFLRLKGNEFLSGAWPHPQNFLHPRIASKLYQSTALIGVIDVNELEKNKRTLRSLHVFVDLLGLFLWVDYAGTCGYILYDRG